MKKLIFIIIICFVGASELYCFEKQTAGARSHGLSNAFVSISDPWSAFHNQAGIAGLEHTSAGVFYESRFMIDELSLVAGTLVLPVKSGTFGLSFFQFGKGAFKSNKIGLAFAKQLSQKLSAGLQLDYLLQAFPENGRANGFATFEFGIIYSPFEKMFLGAHVFNPIHTGFETIIGEQKVLPILRMGGHYRFNEMLLIAFEGEKETNNPCLLKSGIEFFPVENLVLRFGISGRPFKYTFGLGYKIGKISTDIGFGYHGNLGLTPSVSLQFDL